MSRRAVKLIVSGRVQGVWFRASTESKARALGVAGTVRNLPDGAVEIVAEGETVIVDELIEWAWRGSPQSRVRAVEVHESAVSGAFTGFEALY